MKINNIYKSAKMSILAVAIMAPAAATAEVQFTDTFDGTLTELSASRTSGNFWITSRFNSSRTKTTTAEVGNGILKAYTNETKYGGAVMLDTMAELDFFANEVTIVLEGITIESTGNGRLAAQGLRLGVGNRLTFRHNNWSQASYFGLNILGSGRFNFSGGNASPNLIYPIPLQSIPTPFINFDFSSLTALKLTLNDTHYRLAFEFGNPLNALSFAGLHHLSKDLWNVDNDMIGKTYNKATTAEALAAAEAAIPFDQTAVDVAQAAYDDAVLAYDTKWITEEPDAGFSRIFIGALSEDGEGATITVDTLTVETTNILDILKAP